MSRASIHRLATRPKSGPGVAMPFGWLCIWLLPAVTLAQPPDWPQKRADILARMQQVMGALPADSKKVPLEPHIAHAADMGKYVRRKITIAVEAGDRLPLYLPLPKERVGRLRAVTCLHQTDRRLGKDNPVGLGGPADLNYAVHLVERGYVALAPDYVNMGEY